MAYSAVIQPSPRPRRHPGTPSSTDAVHSTRVLPNETRQDPSAYGATPRSNVTGRRESAERPTRTGSAGGGATKRPDDVGGGLPGRQRDDDDVAPPAADIGGTDDGTLVVVAALYENVGPQRPDQLQGGVLLEEHDEIDHLERGEHIGPLRFAAHGPLGTLEAADRGVAVQADDE